MDNTQNIKVTSIKEILDYMILEYGYKNNPRLSLLVRIILEHIKRMDEDYTVIGTFPIEYGIRSYIVENGKLGLVGEMMIESNCDDMYGVYDQYALAYSNNMIERNKVKVLKLEEK